jgi:hypothetical protein
MKNFTEFVNEQKGQPIDDNWLNNEKPVQTKSGHQVIITKIDMSEVPNKIIGQVKLGEDLFEYEWDEKGNCTKALDQRGNPKQPDENDMLVKAI